jgi:antitoxin VapB
MRARFTILSAVVELRSTVVERRNVSLNIKNDETNRLAHELAAVTGESLTTAVTVAVRQRLERLQQSKAVPLAERLLRIGKDCAVHLKEPFLTVDHGDLLYDEKGLPR